MLITRENNEVVIRIPEQESPINVRELQALLDYIVYRRIVSKSKATQPQIDQLARDVNSSWWTANKDQFLKPNSLSL